MEAKNAACRVNDTLMLLNFNGTVILLKFLLFIVDDRIEMNI